LTQRRWVAFVVAALLLAGCGDRAVRGAPAIESTVPAAACPPASPLRIDARVRVGRGAGPMTVAGDRLWTSRPAAGVLVSVGLRATPRAARPVRIGGAPVSLAAGLGSIYVADRDRDRILRLDPVTGKVVRLAAIQSPVKVAVSQAALFAISLDDGALHRLDPLTGVGTPLAIPALAPIDAVLEGGDLWILGGGDAGVSPFDERRNAFVRAGVRMPTRVVGAIAAGAGAVWAALPTARAVARIEPQTLSLGVLRASRGFAPTAVAVDGCSVWLGDSDGRVERIDPATGRTLGRPVRSGTALAALVADRGGVWASDPSDGTVVRVMPAG
jgi:streptogramin lyase